MLCYIITENMLCYITCYITYVMLYNISYVMLCNISYVMIYNIRYALL